MRKNRWKDLLEKIDSSKSKTDLQKFVRIPSKSSKAWNAFLLQGTPQEMIIDKDKNIKEKLSSHIIPDTTPKQDHLFIKSIQLCKNLQTGDWIFGEIQTNKGVFQLGAEQNSKINQVMIKSLVLYLRELFEDDLKNFIKEEDSESD